jgi:amiloride-sensitive sodium channel
VTSRDDEDAACRGPDQGFRVFYHMPNEIPGFWHRSMYVQTAKANSLVMKATQLRTSEDLRRYDVKQRRCYLDGEKNLQFFSSYTKSHCDLECMTNYTLKSCGCVRFYMPHNDSTPVCNITRLECASSAENEWLEQSEDYKHDSMPCKCYPACAQVKYEVEMFSEVDFPTNKTMEAFDDLETFYQEHPG